jgi:hypothetical protein
MAHARTDPVRIHARLRIGLNLAFSVSRYRFVVRADRVVVKPSKFEARIGVAQMRRKGAHPSGGSAKDDCAVDFNNLG